MTPSTGRTLRDRATAPPRLDAPLTEARGRSLILSDGASNGTILALLLSRRRRRFEGCDATAAVAATGDGMMPKMPSYLHVIAPATRHSPLPHAGTFVSSCFSAAAVATVRILDPRPCADHGRGSSWPRRSSNKDRPLDLQILTHANTQFAANKEKRTGQRMLGSAIFPGRPKKDTVNKNQTICSTSPRVGCWHAASSMRPPRNNHRSHIGKHCCPYRGRHTGA